VGGRKSPFPITLAIGLYNSCMLLAISVLNIKTVSITVLAKNTVTDDHAV